jgi:hypothetical protein
VHEKAAMHRRFAHLRLFGLAAGLTVLLSLVRAWVRLIIVLRSYVFLIYPALLSLPNPSSIHALVNTDSNRFADWSFE